MNEYLYEVRFINPQPGDGVAERKLGIFEKYLSIWVALCIIGGIVLGRLLPELAQTLSGI